MAGPSGLRKVISSMLGYKDQERAFVPTMQYPSYAPFRSKNVNAFQSISSLQITAVYACVSKIADTIASMDCMVERISSDGSRTPLSDSPYTKLLRVQPNPLMGAYEFKQMIISDALIYGTGYAVITGGEMFWIPSSEMTFVINERTGEKIYKYTGAPGPIPQSAVIEIKAFRSESPISVQLQVIQTAKSVQNFGHKFFENGGMLGGILTTKEQVKPEYVKELSERWKEEYAGSDNAHKIAIVSGGFDFKPMSVPLQQLQFIETKKYTAQEICQMYQVPPAMIGMEGNTAYSNYEQQVLQFYQGCILPWIKRIELEFERKLLGFDDSLSCRFDVDSLLRADSSARSTYYHSMLADGVLSINEVRSREGLSPVEGGDNHHIQLNQIPLASMDKYADKVTETNNTNGNIPV
jgi:HK97 family phage portal protein